MKAIIKTSVVTSVLSIILHSHSFAATATGTANAKVAAPIAVSAGTALEFGSFASSATAGTITVTNGTRAKTGGVTLISGATPSSASFSVTGDGSSPYTFSLPSSVSLTSGANSMTANLALNAGTASRTLSSGAETVVVNGTLNSSTNQAAGTYTGSYSVDANY